MLMYWQGVGLLVSGVCLSRRSQGTMANNRPCVELASPSRFGLTWAKRIPYGNRIPWSRIAVAANGS